MNSLRLNTIVFVCGACVMILELVGSRIIAPYVGTSIYAWTSLIGVIMACLSLGYWWGGQLSDQQPDPKILSRTILVGAMSVLLLAFLSDPILVAIQNKVHDVRFASLLASLLLFGIPSVFLGTVLPYAVRLKMTSVASSGETVGTLYALSTMGSILGTFGAGFYLISYFKNSVTLLFVGILLGLMSFICHSIDLKALKLIFLVVTGIGFTQTQSAAELLTGKEFVDCNTPYNRVWIFDGYHQTTHRPIRIMQMNDEMDSAMFVGNNDLVFEYTKYFRLFRHFNPDAKKVLMIGGAAYSYPKAFLSEIPDGRIDVVEIDPGVTRLAEKYFNLVDDARLGIFHEDGRLFLNRATEKYDAILVDAFKSHSLPYQLATREAIAKEYDLLNDEGVVLVNLISAVEGENGELLRAVYWTYKGSFPQVNIYAVNFPEDGKQVQNLILVATKSKKPQKSYSTNPEWSGYLNHLWVPDIIQDVPVLTDEYAPADRYTMKVISALRGKGMNLGTMKIKQSLKDKSAQKYSKQLK